MIINVRKDIKERIGALGKINFKKGKYVYVGSAQNNLEKRIARHLSKDKIESVNFAYADLDEMMNHYDPKTLKDGFNTVDGEEIFYISNPGMGLWSWKERFK